MKLLQKFMGVIALFSLIAATQDDSLKNNRAAAVQVKCGGRTWTDGELLGRDNGDRIWTVIIENRIYIKKENTPGRAHDNTGVLFNLDTGLFPVNNGGDKVVDGCVNSADPSTYSNGYLKPQQGNTIICNNKPITDKLFLGTYVAQDKRKTLQYARIINGRLWVNFQQENNIGNFDGLGMNLIYQTIEGEYGSTMSFPLTTDEVKSCFWPNEPKTATLVTVNPACTSGPSIQSISSITKTGLQFGFTGISIPNVKWRIKLNGAEQRSGVTGALSGATTVDISFSSLNAGNYILEVEGGDCTSSVSSRAFTITEPVVVVSPCNGGPAISGISNITPTSLNVSFIGTGIPNLSWKIKLGINELASGKTANLNSNMAVLSFNNLVNGTYTLEIQGGDCTSGVSTQDFTVNANCERGPILQQVGSPTAQNLNFLFDGSGIYGIKWRIMQGNTMVRENSVSPQSNRPGISYETLANGAYTLAIEGGTCNSAVSTLDFRIGNDPLPIYISSFQAATVKSGIDLSWEVVSEKNGEGFEILRLNSDLNKSKVIGKLPLTEQRMGKYHFLDESPAAGTNYYQLKQIDMDGTFTLSKIIGAKFDQIFEAIVAPNPANDYVNIQFTSRTSGVASVELYNIAGIKLSTLKVNMTEGENTHRLNVGKLSDGHYFVKVLHADQSSNLRFVKIN